MDWASGMQYCKENLHHVFNLKKKEAFMQFVEGLNLFFQINGMFSAIDRILAFSIFSVDTNGQEDEEYIT
ncbi:hypothetical protein ACJX0J_028798, partial [Zea mays]